MNTKRGILGICLAWIFTLVGCAETGDQSCGTVINNDGARFAPSTDGTYNVFSYIQGPDDNAVIPPTDTILVPNITAPRVWTIDESNNPAIRRFVARDIPGDQVLLRRENGTDLGAFGGDGIGWITLQRYDDGGGDNWFVVGWYGAVTIPGDP